MSKLKTKKNIARELSSLSNLSKDDFFKKFCKFSKAEVKLLCYHVVIELKNEVLKGNIECFKGWCTLLDFMIISKCDATLVSDPLEHSNLIVLACKHNRFEILLSILNNHSNVLSNIQIITGKITDNPCFKDEESHNAFYYAIRSCNIKLLETLIDGWPGDYFISRSEELEKILSIAYEELKLKNILFTYEMEYFVEEKLISLRFFSSDSNIYPLSFDKIIERINLVLESIEFLENEYSKETEVDDRFLFTAKFIAQNVHMLKKQLKSTYNMLPWEEIEFCLIGFVYSFSKVDNNNVFYRFVLCKERLLFHLHNFSVKLEDSKSKIKCIELCKLAELPNIERKSVVIEIVAEFNAFQKLYDDYIQIRDIHSLQKINDNMEVAMSADCMTEDGKLNVIRSLQVMGENLKNTLESPKLSSSKSDQLILSTPENTREILIDLRNSLSHSHSLDKRIDIEENADHFFYKNIQNDLKKIYAEINDMLYKSKLKIIRILLNQILDSTDFSDILEVIEILMMINLEILCEMMGKESNKTYRSENEKLRKLIDDLIDKIPEKTDYENELFLKIKNFLDPKEEFFFPEGVKAECLQGLLNLRSICDNYPNYEIDFNLIRLIKFHCKTALKDIAFQVDVKNIKSVGEIAIIILKSVSSRLKQNTGEIIKLFYNVFYIAEFETDNISGIEELREKLKLVRVKRKKKAAKAKYNTAMTIDLEHEFKKKLCQLQNIIKNNISININKKVFHGALEMLILDIMSIVEKSKMWHLNNLLFLDAYSPLLYGKFLRNYLAHGNALFDILCNPLIAILSNAKLLSEQNDFKDYHIIGKLNDDDPTTLRNKFYQSLAMLENQRNMFIALEKGNLEAFKNCLNNGADIYGRSINLWTAMHCACKGLSLEIVKLLLNQNIDVEAKDKHGKLPIHTAVTFEQKHILEYFLTKKVFNVDASDTFGKTPLHIASFNGHRDIVKILLKHKANIHVKDCFLCSPLHRAVQKNHKDVVKILLEKGVNIDCESTIGFTSLHIAAERGYVELINFLLQNKATINVKSDRGGTPLHLAVVGNHIDVVKALISNGADTNFQVHDGCTALHFAIEYFFEDIVKILLDHEADVNLANTVHRNTSLHYGARHGPKNIVEMLLQKGANVNLVTTEGCTPLFLAVVFDHADIVGILIKSKALVNIAAYNGDTPLHACALYNRKDLIKFLTKSGANINSKNKDGFTSLHIASKLGHIESIDILISNGANVNDINYKSNTALHLGIQGKHKDVTELLIQKDADINARNFQGMTPLHFAAQNDDSTEIVKLLIALHVNVNSIDKKERTPLHLAALNGKNKIAEILIENGADVNFANCDDMTPIYFAVQNAHRGVIETLINHGADFNNVNKCDLTVLCLAVRCNNLEIVKILVNKGADVNFKNGVAFIMAVMADNKNIMKYLLMNSNIKNEILSNALIVAAKEGVHNVIKDLIKRGADVNILFSGLSPLHIAAELGHTEVVRILIENRANVNITSEYGCTPLHRATKYCHNDVVEILVKHNACIQAKDEENRSSLQFAISSGDLNIVKTLLRNNEAYINVNNEGWTLLHIAADTGYLEILKYLINKGADSNAKNSFGSKPIHIAARDGHLNIVEFFLDNQLNDIYDLGASGFTLLHYAASNGQLEVAKYLIDKNIDVNSTDENGIRPINIAAKFGFGKIVELLINKGSIYDPHIHFKTTNRPNVVGNDDVSQLLKLTEELFEATKLHKTLEVETYIRKGAFINAKNVGNMTSLHYASWKGYDSIVEILLNNNANPNIIGIEGFTPLHFASKFNHLNIVKLLLSHGAIYNFCNEKYKTPLDLTDNEDIIKILTLIADSFKFVKNGNSKIIDDMTKIKNPATIKAVMNALDKGNNKSLIVTAIQNDFPKINQLMQVFKKKDFVEIEIAKSLIFQENYQEALNVYNKILERRKKVLGPDNLITLDLIAVIANIHHKKGNLQEALSLNNNLYLKQIEIIGPNYKNSLYTRSGIALLLHRLGRSREALNIYLEVYPKQRDLLGENHKDTNDSKFHMALVLEGLNRYEEALQHYYEIYEMRKSTLKTKNNDLSTVLVQNNIAIVLSKQGKYEEALVMYKEVYETRRRLLGPHCSDTLRVQFNMAEVLCFLKRYDVSLKLHEEVLHFQKIKLGTSHPDTLTTTCSLGNLLLLQDKYIRAFKVYTENIEQMKKVWGPNHPNVLSSEKMIELINFQFKMGGGITSSDLKIIKKNIHAAANDNDLKTIEELIKIGIDVNCKDREGRTSLHFAVNNRNKNTIMTLLKHGADATLTTSKGNTPLHTAVYKGFEEIVEILVEHVKQINLDKLNNFINTKTNNGGTTAIHVAAQNGSLEILKCLLMYGAIYDIKDNKHKKPQNYTTHQGILNILELTEEAFEYAKIGNIKIITKLKEKKHDVTAVLNARNSEGQSAAQIAFISNHVKLGKSLIELLREVQH